MCALHVLSDIFSAPLPRIQLNLLPQSLADIVRNMLIPKFTSNDLKLIVNRMKSDEPLASILDSVNYGFPYSETLLQEILTIDNADPEVVNNAAILGIYSFVTWMSYLGTGTQPNVKPLLQALLHIRGKGQIVDSMIGTAMEVALQHLDDGEAFSLSKEFAQYTETVRCEELGVLMYKNMARKMNSGHLRVFVVQLIKLILDKDWCFSESQITEMMQVLDPAFFLDPTMAQFLSLSNMSVGHLVILSQSLPTVFFRKLEGKECLNLPQSSEAPVTYPMIGAPKAYMEFPEVETLPGGFDPSEVVSFPPIENLASYFDEDVLADCRLLTEFLVSQPEAIRSVAPGVLVSGFFTFFEDIEDDPRFYSMFGIMLILTNMILCSGVKFQLAVKVAKNFYNKRIFDPGITIFSENIDFSLLNTFRALCLDGVLWDTGAAVDHIISNEIGSMPLILAETCYRLSNMCSVLAPRIQADPRLIKTLINVSLFYQHLEIESTYDKKNIRTVRISLLSLIAHIFTDMKMMELFFRDSLFCNSFLALLFEESVRPFIISTLTSYLSVGDFRSNTEFLNNLIAIIRLINLLLPAQQPLLLLRDLITCLGDSFAYHQDGISEFSHMCLILCQSMAKLSTDSLSKQVYETVISFLSIMSPYFVITPLEVDALITGLVAFGDIEFTSSLQNKFLVLLAGQTVGSLTPNFIIQQPQVLKLFIQTLFDTPKFCDILEFIISLCKYSPRNLEACGKSDLDLFVLGYLERAKTTESMPQEIVKLFLELYSLLSLASSSLQSVLRYVSLMSPVDGVHVSKYQDLFIENLNQIALSSSNEPETSLALNGTVIEFPADDIQFPTISNGFNVTFWLYIEPNASDYRPYICSAHLGNGMKLKFFLSNSSLLVQLDHGKAITTGILREGLENNTWHFVATYFQIRGTRAMLHYSINGSITGMLTLPGLEYDLVPEQVAFCVGGPCETEVCQPSRLGAIGFYRKLTPDELISIFELGLRHNRTLPVDAVVYVSDFTLCARDSCVHDPLGFLNVLVTQCSVTSLLPLFCQSNSKLTDGTDYSISLESLFVLLQNILAFSQEAEVSFYQNSGFGIMAHLLLKYWTKLFNMKRYLQLFQMLASFQCEPLEQQLFDEIMTDFTFLMSLEPALHLRIVKHWAQSLFTSFAPIAQNFSSFEDMMAILRLFYWYRPVEENLIKYREIRPDELNVKACRKYIFMILRDYARDNFGESEFQCIVSHAITCSDTQQQQEILELLADICVEETIPIHFDFGNSFFEDLVVFAMRNGSDLAKIQVLKIVAICHKRKLITTEFASKQITVCIVTLSPEAMTHELFLAISEILLTEPIFLPIACYIAMFLGENEFLSQVPTSSLYCESEFWAIWLVALCLAAPDRSRVKIMEWMIICAKGNLCSVHGQIDVILDVYPEFSEVIESAFLEGLCKAVADHGIITDETFADFFALCKRLICFERRSQRCRAFLDLRYAILNQEDVNQSPVFVASAFIQRVTSQDVVEPELAFGLSFDKYGNWVHQELAKLLLVISHSYPPLPHESCFELLLCSLLLRKGVDITVQLSEIVVDESLMCEIMMQAVNHSYGIFTGKQKKYFQQAASSNPFKDRHKYEIISGVAKASTFSSDLAQMTASFNKFKSGISEMWRMLDNRQLTIHSELAFSQMRLFVDRQNLQNEANLTAWDRLWRVLSIERGPWYYPSKEKIKWKRDIAACFAFAPVKMVPDKPSMDLRGDNKTPPQRGILSQRACQVIGVKECRDAQIILYGKHLTIIIGNKYFSISYDDVVGLFRRHQGLHLFTALGQSFHLQSSPDIVDEIISLLDRKVPQSSRRFPFEMQDQKAFFQVTPLLNNWQKGRVSNYEYLLMLNSIVGRSFNDVSNYPIFPWVLSDFANLDSIRDFSQNIGNDLLPRAAVTYYLLAIHPFASFHDYDSHPSSVQSFLNFVNETGFEFVPELYSMPEILDGLELPSWASSPIDFVYKHRKVLESETVSSAIHLWIQQVFGDSLFCFNFQHPQRDPIRHGSALKRAIDYNIGSSVDAAVITEENSLVYHFLVYTRTGQVTELVLDATLPVRPSPKVQTSPRESGNASPSTRFFRALPNATHFGIDKSHLICVTPGRPLVSVDLANGKATEIDIGASCVNDIEIDGTWTVAGGDNATITLLRGNKIFSNIRLFRDAVTACAVSAVFNIVVGGTKDSALIFCSAVTGSIIKVINLQPSDSAVTECAPQKILITPAWGFVVAYVSEIELGVRKHMILVYTVNGIFVHKTEIPFAIDFWYSWKSNCGFDYIVYSSDTGELYFSEVYNLSKGGTPIWSCRAPIVAAHVSPDTDTLVVTTKTGRITILPL